MSRQTRKLITEKDSYLLWTDSPSITSVFQQSSSVIRKIHSIVRHARDLLSDSSSNSKSVSYLQVKIQQITEEDPGRYPKTIEDWIGWINGEMGDIHYRIDRLDRESQYYRERLDS